MSENSAHHLRLAANRTLLPLLLVQVSLGRTEDQALALVENYELFPAFNISRTTRKTREIRVWRDALLAWKPDQRPGPQITLEAAISAALPAYAATTNIIRGHELRARFSCSASQIVLLIRSRELKLARQAHCSESPYIDFSSVVEFLKRRAI